MRFIKVVFLILCVVTGLVYTQARLHDSTFQDLGIMSNDDDGYGTRWIYFPDGDGYPHYVNLTIAQEEILTTRLSSSAEILFRLHIGNDTESYVLLDNEGRPMNKSDRSIVKNKMSSKKSLKLLTHGWLSSVDKPGVSDLKNAYLETQNVDVITVDWSATASSLFYPWVANETKDIGARIGSFLDGLSKWYNVTGERVHLIGHSLGAHVMGIAAFQTKMRVNRITEKLDSSDADFVDIIHTCAGLLGFLTPIGTVDFYPNNGVAPQPGCEDIVKFFDGCSHGRSFYYFMESVKYPKSFPTYRCETWDDFLNKQCDHHGYMGEGVNRTMEGKYYLITNPFEPFGKGV
ncbi:hypothetical protein HF086_010261 [Spodoptera exigua]|uniref:Lipase domain-containing protein n=1 Tax=Spodoptera exigua TaxID=7107 RepID=A0A922M947_SPOEX|nr:hypothetical protein HF086_010261 [Spodoptera exigua]